MLRSTSTTSSQGGCSDAIGLLSRSTPPLRAQILSRSYLNRPHHLEPRSYLDLPRHLEPRSYLDPITISPTTCFIPPSPYWPRVTSPAQPKMSLAPLSSRACVGIHTPSLHAHIPSHLIPRLRWRCHSHDAFRGVSAARRPSASRWPRRLPRVNGWRRSSGSSIVCTRRASVRGP